MVDIIPTTPQSPRYYEQSGGVDTNRLSSDISDKSYTNSDLVSIAIEATENLHLSEHLPLESQLVDSFLNCVRSIPVVTVSHIPRNIRLLLSQVLCSVLKAATQSVWGILQLALFPKAILRAPPQHSPPRC